jgi:SAM-dependent methyltransferase
MRNRLGMAAPMLTEDRRVLEQVIFGHFCCDSRIKTVLFVGCDSYTAHYQRRYFAKHDYWTLDPDPRVRRFGAKQHVAARAQELGQRFPGGFFDLIMCNGVYGWGLDSAVDCDTAFSQFHDCLADGGYLLIGWNDLPGRDPAPLAQVRSLSRFEQYSLPALGNWRYLTDTPHRHTYCCYRKIDDGCSDRRS